jgi:hypothetical protein
LVANESLYIHEFFPTSIKFLFKFSPEDRHARSEQIRPRKQGAKRFESEIHMREAIMDCAARDDSAANLSAEPDAEAFYTLGMQCSIGGETPADLVSAHKWFNLAAMQGNLDAARLRREIAALMSNAEIGAAQRAARDYIKQHPDAFAQRAERLNAAA